jgi:Flp pilus assembly protein TadD
MSTRALLEAALVIAVASLALGGCDTGEEGEPSVEPWRTEGYTGSTASCRECHEPNYQIWAASHHGLAMQPFTEELAQSEFVTTSDDITIGDYRFRVVFDEDGGWVNESGPGEATRYRIEHALGGKNVYFFLTPMERGRLQVLPLAYDVRRREWFDVTGSMVRHSAEMGDEPLPWTDRLLTFNTACFSCHVSQLSTFYDASTDSYETVWAEPGINCESCHGPAEEHIEVFREVPEGAKLEDPKIISVKAFNVEQHNAACAPCHAKMFPLTNTFLPGDRFFDHFDLTTLEHPDFYPDGRDLGENYTYTSWLSSACIGTGQLDCLHCHTSSGRYRFEENANEACLPCHRDKAADPSAHTRHANDSEGSQCVSCHMPTTEFARMERSDHSMRAPTPAATLEFGSPNACNLCHSDRDAAWADRRVREWHGRNSQAPALQRARLIDQARRGEWSALPAMLDFVRDEKANDVFKASLLRLLIGSDDERKWPAIMESLSDRSPLVRAAAAQSLSDYLAPEAIPLLLQATRDEYRLVRVNAASALGSLPDESVADEAREGLDRATAEFVASNEVRPDRWGSHFALGNFYMRRGELSRAIEAYERAHSLDRRMVAPLINAAIAYGLMGEETGSEGALLRALEVEPDNPVVNMNLGLLLGEQGRSRGAEAAFRKVMEVAPDPIAAHNLCVLLSSDRLEEAIDWCRRAVELEPAEPEYAYSLGFYLGRSGDVESAIRVLGELPEEHFTSVLYPIQRSSAKTGLGWRRSSMP